MFAELVVYQNQIMSFASNTGLEDPYIMVNTQTLGWIKRQSQSLVF